MPLTIARLRQGILIIGGLLVAVLIGFLIYAHYRIRRFEKDLPARLGANIQQTANGYTVSQSSKGHTLFTLHASKLIQYKQGGDATLHDVAITLYGPPGSSRVDKIYGASFNYDGKDGIATAQGEVSIDLQGFGKANQPAKNTIHVKTSGLVFNQKTGQADTTQHTEFAFPRASGSSTGAHYNSKTGELVLDKDVELATNSNGKPAVIHAAYARMDRNENRAFLLAPIVDSRSEKGSSDTAVVGFRDDGSAQTIDAQGHVRVVTAEGAVLTASSSLSDLNDESHPTRTDLEGGVNFVSNSPDADMRGTARSGTLTFSADSVLRHAQFRDAVHFTEEIPHLANDPKGSASRQIEASRLDVDFAPGADGKSVARQSLATGNASVKLGTRPSKGLAQYTTISGDKLLALLTPDGKAVRQLNGTGNTRFTSLAKDGSTNTSTGDTLEVTFATTPGSKKAPRAEQAGQIETAIQNGNVVLTQAPVAKSGAPPPATMRAWSQHSEYHAADQLLRLTGNPRLEQGSALQMTADEVDYHRDTGDAAASGGVKATYAESNAGPTLNGNGPVHITADHALLHHASGTSDFYGSGATDARMWQGADSILAPVIELTRVPQTLRAFGAPGSRGPAVDANLTSAASADHRPGFFRVRSHTLLYTDADRRGDFRGDVTAADASGVIHADNAQFYLTPAGKPGGRTGKTQRSQLERVVATGHVVLRQPGRTGTGEKLIYTAADGQYVLTGSPASPPRIRDAAKGITTGAKLIFNSQNDSVEVSGGQSSAVTLTRAPR